MPSNVNLDLDYYYGTEEDRFNFYRVPKTLLTDPRYKSVSIEAKVLYGLLLDRMGLSVKNGWMDKEHRVYIYFTQEDAMELMGCGKDKTTRLFRELDQNGIGLIERKKQGQGRPARIYVKNLTPPADASQPQPEQVPSCNPQTVEDQQQPEPLDNSAVKTAPFEQSAPLEMRGQDCAFCVPNKTDMNKTDSNYTESSILPPTPRQTVSRPAGNAKPRMRMDEMEDYMEQIRENIDYDLLFQERPYDLDEINGYVELMAETCASRREYSRVNGEDLPMALVKKRFLTLDGEHIRYVMDSLRHCTTRVVNIRAYTLAALYNAPTTINQYYTTQVSYDMAQGYRSA